MSRVMDALEQLDVAIGRLETAVEKRLGRDRAERERLNDELKGLRQNHVTLQSEARTVSSRLDAAIGRLRSILET
jgi:predicted  nucleic acid-binding Zn-ribbon protein